MALVRAHGGRTRDTTTGRITRTPGRQFGTRGGRAFIPVSREPPLITTSVPLIVAAIERAAARVSAFVALRLVERLIEATPVDTGFARASWIASVGVRTNTVGGTRNSVSESAQQLGMTRLLNYRLVDGVIFVSNNVPYIMRLNAGWSQQAPIGFIEFAVTGAHADAEAYFGGQSL